MHAELPVHKTVSANLHRLITILPSFSLHIFYQLTLKNISQKISTSGLKIDESTKLR